MPKLFKLNSDKLVNVSPSKYQIDWFGKSCSKIQKLVKDFLFPFWKHHLVCEEVRIPGSLLRLDIVNFTSKIIVEVSPTSHHGTFNPFFHKHRLNYKKSIDSDFKKLEYAERNGYKFVEITEEDFPLTRQLFIDKFDIYL